MNLIDALGFAIVALDEKAHETYEGGELEEPCVAEWVDKQEAAMLKLTELLGVVTNE